MIITILFVMFLMFNIRCTYFEPKWFALCSAAAAMLSLMIFRQSSAQFALLYFYILFQALYHGLHSISRKDFISVQFYAMKSALAVIAFGLTFLFLDLEMISSIHKIIPFVLIGNFLYKLLPTKFRMMTAPNGKKDVCQGIGGNYSVDSSLISILYAISLGHHQSAWLSATELLCVIGSLAYNKASAGLIAFILSSSLYLILNGHYMVVVCLFIVSCAIFYKFKKKLMTDCGRFRSWRFMWKHIVKKMNSITGIGQGVFRYEMPLQETINEKTEMFGAKNSWFIWSHNDFFQYFIENGCLGLVLLTVCLLSIVGMPVQFWVIAVSVGVNAAINFPFHLAPEAFLIAMTLKEYYLGK